MVPDFTYEEEKLFSFIREEWPLDMDNFRWNLFSTTVLNEHLTNKKGNMFVILSHLLQAYQRHIPNSANYNLKRPKESPKVKVSDVSENGKEARKYEGRCFQTKKIGSKRDKEMSYFVSRVIIYTKK